MTDRSTSNQPVQRTFIIGDQWLYYKFYTGPKTADLVLTEMIKPVSEKLLAANLIDRWFFIRYADPRLHLRVRFHYTTAANLQRIIEEIHTKTKPLVDRNLIWKVQLDTYQRELERYGARTIDLAEELFYYDSRMIVGMLDMLEGDEGEHIRWLFSLRAIDQMLDDFSFTEEEKLTLINRLKDGFGQEFGLNRSLKKQLEQKFRSNRTKVNDILDRSKDESSPLKPLLGILNKKSINLKPVANKILAASKGDEADKMPNDFMGSFLHMMINRMFKTKQRLHELALYDLLSRYYRSSLARKKYNR
jgi:thiopeptide-type bacteriocin biosynthesis protein